MIPFLTVYLQYLRLTAPETGVVTGVAVLVAFLVRPLLGVLGDCFRVRRALLALCCLLFGAAFCSLWSGTAPSGQTLLPLVRNRFLWSDTAPSGQKPLPLVRNRSRWSDTAPFCQTLLPLVRHCSLWSDTAPFCKTLLPLVQAAS